MENIDNKEEKKITKKKTTSTTNKVESSVKKSSNVGKKNNSEKVESSKSKKTTTKKIIDSSNENKEILKPKRTISRKKTDNIDVNSDNLIKTENIALNESKIDIKIDEDGLKTNNNDNTVNSNNKIKLESKLVKKDKLQFNLLEVIIIMIITIVFSAIFAGILVYSNYDKIVDTTSNSSDVFSELKSSYYDIINNYAGEVDKEELIDAAISGMYNYLGDSYSYYIDKDSNDTLQDTLNGEYEGIGVEITSVYNNDGTYKTYISKVFADTPAEKAGLKVGDIFVSLNGVDLSDKDSTYVADTIKNGAQSDNTITVNRDGKDITLNVKREHVYIDSVKSEVKDGVGYIKIETFSLTTASLVRKAIDSFDSSVKSVVIDLRDNGGGYTISAYDTANLFIEKGKNIYQMKDKDGYVTDYKADSNVYRNFDKIAVLINEESASSSEILALALKESAGATIVGTKSFGKGTVQETKQLSSGAMVKYTIGYWLSPNGNSINETGITPDIIVEDIDNQINKAIEAVK